MVSYKINKVCKLLYTNTVKIQFKYTFAWMNVQRKKGLKVTYNHHVEIAVDLRIILLNLVLNLTNSQLLFTWIDLFILKKDKSR